MKLIEQKLGKYAVLTGYLHEYSEETPNILNYPAILILPGGGFRSCSYREGEPVAMAYYAAGFQAFVLKYTVVTDDPNAVIADPMEDVCQAMAYIRSHEEELFCGHNMLALLGFSGGGHLAAAAATHCSPKPDALLLGYPGIIHSDLRALDCPDIPEQVSAELPPCFLFSMHGDSVTPPIHLLTFACALEKVKVPFELHMFRGRGHGLSLGTSLTAAGFASDVNSDYGQWLNMSIRWLKDVFGDFLLYGCNDGRQGKYSIDCTVETLFANQKTRQICMETMPVLANFAKGESAQEMTPRRINSFMHILPAQTMENMDAQLLQCGGILPG